jgi:hypothetical protein
VKAPAFNDKDIKNMSTIRFTSTDSRQAALREELAVHALVSQASSLVSASAIHLGLNPTEAEQVAHQGLIEVVDKKVSIVPVKQTEDGNISLLLSVDTERAIGITPSAEPRAVLQHTPGALLAFSAGIGCTPSGNWVVHRAVSLHTSQSQELAEAILSTVQLADFILHMIDGGNFMHH